MRNETYALRSTMPGSVEDLDRWHRRPGALERLRPPWEPVEVVERTGNVEPGDRTVLSVGLGPFSLRWEAVHRALPDPEPGERGFVDEQLEGPFARWTHLHRFRPSGDAAELVDNIRYAVPLGAPGRLLVGPFVRRRLGRAFRYRHRVLAGDLRTHLGAATRTSLHVAVTGSTGLVGEQLVAFLRSGGHRITRIVRRRARPDRPEAEWDPATGYVDGEALEGIDAVVHLAGEPVEGLWTASKKAAIRESRVRGTRALAGALASLEEPPRVLVSTSGVHYYGDRGEELLTEDSGPGEGFLSGVCRGWEEATAPAAEAGVRVVRLRLGMVLSPDGGALGRMLPVYLLGLGGPLGSGRQWLSWIALDDVLDVVHRALFDADLEGPVNAVAPGVARNAEFATTLARVVSRKAPFRLPATLLEWIGGQMAEELLLASTRVKPERLEARGFSFRYPDLESALRHVLGRAGASA